MSQYNLLMDTNRLYGADLVQVALFVFALFTLMTMFIVSPASAVAQETETVVPPEPTPAEPAPATITIEKVTPDSGEAETFNFSGDLGSFSLTGNTSKTFTDLTPETTYFIEEETVDGWELVEVNCDTGEWDLAGETGVVVAPGEEQHIACVFFNEPVEPEPILGCTDPEAINYDEEATEDDGSCEYEEDPILGCTDPEGLNFDPEATEDDGSCEYDQDPDPVATGTVKVFKWVDGDNKGPALPGDFSFSLDGGSTSETFGPLAFKKVILPFGTYTLSETNIPSNYSLVDIQCQTFEYGGHYDLEDDAEQVHSYALEDLWPDEHFTFGENEFVVCVIINTFEEDNGGGGGNKDTGILQVTKTVVGTTTSLTGFSFVHSDGTSTSSPIAFTASGTNQIELPVGSYTVTEVDPGSNYTVSYDNCSSVTISKDSSSTCAIINTWNIATDTPEVDLYKVEGYVWHDDNENTIWDGVDNDDQSANTEPALAGWKVTITNGNETFSTTTDQNGYYYFEVPAGTWTISEQVQNGWKQTAPTTTTYTVTVPATPTTLSLVDSILNFLVPTAHAAVVDTFGLFNFGNDKLPEVTNGGGGGGGGRRHSGGSKSGSSSDNSSDDSNETVNTPEPQVLGEQVSAVPFGAPNAGAGGTASPIVVFSITAVRTTRRIYV